MKRMFRYCIYILLLLLLTGCWDRYELEDRANILGLAVDLAEKSELNDEPEVTHQKGEFPEEKRETLYKVTAQIAVPGKIKLGPEGGGGQGSEKTAWVLETFGHTMKDAMANLQQQLAEKLYLGHLQIVVVSEDIAKRGLSEVNDFLRRDHEVRRTAWMIVNEKDASKVIKTAPPLETVPSLYLSDTLDNAVRFGKLPREYLGKFWIDISDDGVNAVLPSVKAIDGDRILVDGLAFFRNEKMVGRTTPIEIGMYMSMKEKNGGGYSVSVSLEGEEGVYLVKAEKRKPHIKVSLKNGKPSAEIAVEIEAVIEEEVNNNQLSEEKIKQLKKAADQKRKELCEKLLGQLQKEGSDVLGIGARIRAKYGDYWDTEVKTEEKWSEIYKEMKIKVTVDHKIRRAGMEWN
ncbi:Ger(x)C family spore germination protein [Bacillus sp. Marseille-P3661]|uniref:Ger(x)C family spore germination protein n=1 Tax=Bacillus sp. Marseille-P3661 TaxID=1936234 RepID=UPI000C85B8BA|nr:Ger(x)C family spore germination protein [Bacillus sp. Marseille-P3661]